MTHRTDGYKRRVDNKLPHFGEVDDKKKVITINKSIHKKAKKKSMFGIPKKDATIDNTIRHEELHVEHPKFTEAKVRKEATKQVAEMSEIEKLRMRRRFS